MRHHIIRPTERLSTIFPVFHHNVAIHRLAFRRPVGKGFKLSRDWIPILGHHHVWSYDFLIDRTEEGRQLRLLAVIDEYTRECLAIEVTRSFTAQDVTSVPQYLFAVRGTPQQIRSDNGLEFVAKAVRRWLERADVKTLFIAKGSPWENGYVQSFNGKLRDEWLNRELFLLLDEARWVIDRWRLDYNHHRPHSSLEYQTPAAFAAGCVLPGFATLNPLEHSRVT